MAAAAAGTVLELYDFTLYGTAAALVFGPVFFPHQSGLSGTLLAFATFGVGFAARPLGALVFGHFGDRLGRKGVLLSTLCLMGVATMLIGLLPGYGTLGVWAPILLTVLRLTQGFSQGGENGAAGLMTAEHAPPRWRGLFSSLPAIGAPLGMLLATGAFTLTSGLTGDAFLDWGWRIPFLAGILPTLLGIALRAGLPESPAFVKLKDGGGTARRPISQALRTAWRPILVGMGGAVGFNAFIYVLNAFSLTYVTTHLGLSRETALTGVMLGSVVLMLATVSFAALSDHVGRKPVMLAGAAFVMVYSFGLFALLDTANPTVVVLAMLLGYLGSAALFGPAQAFMAELFPVQVRNSAMSMSYQTASVLGGGLSPFIATALLSSYGSSMPISIYLCLGAAISLVSLSMVQETRHRSLDPDPLPAPSPQAPTSRATETQTRPGQGLLTALHFRRPG
ncbi:MFS transporter [Streptomyces chartreusis]|uniref:MFS transporter n=1 Tax=Streptomyces chartreusis TaxID=1969 RepID=UPI003809029D